MLRRLRDVSGREPASAAVILSMYSHLWPHSEDRTRKAVERTRWNPTQDQGDSLRARTSGDR
jgi:hypothetical protein